MTRRPRQGKAVTSGRAAPPNATAPDAEDWVEKAEQPDRAEAPTADTEERPDPNEDDRSRQTDIERTQERQQGSVETARQEPEDDVAGFEEPRSASSASSN
jgi:hypothetical protein